MPHRTVKSLLALGVLVLLTTGSAQADVASSGWEPESPSTAVPLDFPILRGAEGIAETYWASRGVVLPQLEGVYELPAEERYASAGGYSDLPGNRIWLAGWLMEHLQWKMQMTRVTLCYTVIHERGHNAGLRHSDAAVFPIMAIPDEVGPGFWRREVAPRCWAWARHPFAGTDAA